MPDELCLTRTRALASLVGTSLSAVALLVVGVAIELGVSRGERARPDLEGILRGRTIASVSIVVMGCCSPALTHLSHESCLTAPASGHAVLVVAASLFGVALQPSAARADSEYGASDLAKLQLEDDLWDWEVCRGNV